MLTISHISKSYQHQKILSDITFTVTEGKTVGISGENGAGKTTLLRIIARIISPDEGDIMFKGKSLLSTNPVIRRYLLYLGHYPNLYPGFTGEENLKFVMQLYGYQKSQKKIEDTLSEVGLIKHRWKPIRNYSKGMLQRLVLAKALVIPWDLLLLDEPMAGLDETGIVLLQLLIEKWQKEKKTLLMVSHQKGWLEKYCQNIMYLVNGQLQD